MQQKGVNDMNKIVKWSLIAVVCFFSIDVFPLSDQEKREIEMAENSIFWALVAANTPAGQRACSESWFACSDDRAELGIALLGAKTSQNAVNSLAGLMRYRLDAGLSEAHTCYLLAKRKAGLDALNLISAVLIHDKCVYEVEKVRINQPKLFNDIDDSIICSPINQIEKRRLMLMQAIEKRKLCLQDDY
jgi:hypothetical protein